MLLNTQKSKNFEIREFFSFTDNIS